MSKGVKTKYNMSVTKISLETVLKNAIQKINAENESNKPKRNRAPNFSQNEKETFINIIFQYKDTVESKRTDGGTLIEKETAWQSIAAQFQAKAGVVRPIVSLRNLWDNIKKRSRRNLAELQAAGCEHALSSFDRKVINIMTTSSDEIDNCIFIEDPEYNHEENSAEMRDNSADDFSFSALDETETIQPPKRMFTARKRRKVFKTVQELYWEKKSELLEMSMANLVEDEKRKQEIHELEVKERNLRIQVMERDLNGE